MAISKTIQASNGLTATDAYIRVGQILCLTKSLGLADVHYFATQGHSIAFDTKSFEFAYDIDGANPIKQAYEYLKALPEFQGATDC